MKRFVPVLLAVAIGCSSEPSAPLGTISSEQAQQLVIERDEARDALAARERQLQAEIDQLRGEIAELRGSAGSQETGEAETPTVAAQPKPETIIAVDLANVSAKPLRSTDNYTYFSWQATVRNNLDRPISVLAVVSLQDSEGYEIDRASELVLLQPAEERTLTGVEMVSNEVASRVAKVGGKIES